MDDIHRLKIKIGPHEFEAEGTAEDVQQQFLAFKELITLAASTPSLMHHAQASQGGRAEEAPQPSAPDMAGNGSELLAKIMRVDGRNVSLTARPDGVNQAILLILYGQKELRQNDSVTGAEIMNGLVSTGGFSVKRVDRYLENLADEGAVIVVGEHRAKRYRLTNAGYARAGELAAALIATVP